ncbi:MAG TPA: MerR family DNA-binding transcriptional regulator [Gemmatimonadales bacterium]|nr:MerR family DNA-binding transcriptional regulator [Gemmatimonadales bacterium]
MPRRGLVRDEFGAEGLLSIGALSTATGIPIDTIRTWERRYGFPVPERKPSGHRVYSLDTVPRLRRAAQAIARGHRAAEVIPASESALNALLDSTPPQSTEPAQVRASPAEPAQVSGEVQEAFEAVRAYDNDRLKRRLHADWARLGPLAFLEHAAAFLTELGEAWAKGQLDVRHEHFASGVLGDFLRAVRSPLDDRATGPIAALATLPGELHGLGLQMAAVVFALAGWRPLVLGVDTPVAQIAALTREVPIAAVALSWIQTRARNGIAAIRALRRRLPRHIPILLGGRGAPSNRHLRGVEIVRDLAGLDRWLRERGAR